MLVLTFLLTRWLKFTGGSHGPFEVLWVLLQRRQGSLPQQQLLGWVRAPAFDGSDRSMFLEILNKRPVWPLRSSSF